MPLRTAIGWTSRCSSSRRPASSSWRTIDGDPLMPMSPPGSFFSAVTASTKSPWSCSEFRHVKSRFWFETTILRHVAELLGEPGVLFAGCLAVGPCAREAVVGHAADEHRVGLVEHAADRHAHLLVEVREVPLVGSLDDPIQRDEHACDDLPHDVASECVRSFPSETAHACRNHRRAHTFRSELAGLGRVSRVTGRGPPHDRRRSAGARTLRSGSRRSGCRRGRGTRTSAARRASRAARRRRGRRRRRLRARPARSSVSRRMPVSMPVGSSGPVSTNDTEACPPAGPSRSSGSRAAARRPS